jgi:hypothetical protein
MENLHFSRFQDSTFILIRSSAKMRMAVNSNFMETVRKLKGIYLCSKCVKNVLSL